MTTHLASLAVIIGCLISASHGDIFQGPQNDAQLVGNDIVLTCQSTLTGLETVQFREYQTNPNGAVISSGQTLLPGHPNYFRSSLAADIDAGTYTLTITKAVLEDGGRYSCADANAVPAVDIKFADVVIIAGQPNCTTTLPGNRIVNIGDYYTAECYTTFSATFGITPTSIWSGFGEFAQASTSTNTTTFAGVAFNVQKIQDGRAFTCRTNFTQSGFGSTPDTATNIPSYQYTYNTGLLFVQYGPTNVSYSPVQASYEVGQVLTCYADAVPLPSYTWTNLVTLEEIRSQSLTLTPSFIGDIVLRCQVVNSVSTANLFINTTVNPITTPTTPTTTTPAPTVPAVAPCDDLTGRWEYTQSYGAQTVLCINIDKTQNGLVRGLYWNDTNEPYFAEIIGRTRNEEYDEIGFTSMWPDRIGVSSFAGECHKCRGVENLLVNAVSRSSAEQAFCADGGTILLSEQFNFRRVPVSFPCSSNFATMEGNMAKMAARRRRRMAAPSRR